MTFPIHMDALGAFVAQLRNEGFDARTDLFNGQVGLIVGPKGLDPKRMPPDTAGFFFPLWELNYGPNSALVEARRFHDILESRPTDWKFNQPYQRSADHVRLDLRHWNRSASLLGDKNLEGTIQQELIRRFPPSDFPVNIDVVGAQNCTYAIVQVNNIDGGIDEKAKAIPEEFIGTGGMTAAVIAAAGHVIFGLQRTGRIPPTAKKQSAPHGNVRLKLRAIGRAGTGSDMTKWDRVYQYEVQGLPPGEQGWIANFGGQHEESWRILRATNGVQSDWSGDYETAEAALAVIQNEFE